jgi:sugar (pentulose or hexulose) kinase
VTELTALAADVPPGAHGVIALPWHGGARAPWWRSDVDATWVGVTAATTPGELARAVYEGVAHDIRRALARLPQRPRELRLAGGGTDDPVWRDVIGGVTGIPTAVGAGADAGAIGAAMLAARVDSPPRTTAPVAPDPGLVAAYADLAITHDAAAAAVLESSP